MVDAYPEGVKAKTISIVRNRMFFIENLQLKYNKQFCIIGECDNA